MKPTDEIHAETVAMLSAAVVGVTERAIEPALAPFQKELRTLTAALEQKINEIDELLRGDQDGRAELRREVRQVGVDLGTQAGAVGEIGRLVDNVAALSRAAGMIRAAHAEAEYARRAEAQRFGEQVADLGRGLRDLDATLNRHAIAEARETARLRTMVAAGLAVASGLALLSVALGTALLLLS